MTNHGTEKPSAQKFNIKVELTSFNLSSREPTHTTTRRRIEQNVSPEIRRLGDTANECRSRVRGPHGENGESEGRRAEME